MMFTAVTSNTNVLLSLLFAWPPASVVISVLISVLTSLLAEAQQSIRQKHVIQEVTTHHACCILKHEHYVAAVHMPAQHMTAQ